MHEQHVGSCTSRMWGLARAECWVMHEQDLVSCTSRKVLGHVRAGCWVMNPLDVKPQEIDTDFISKHAALKLWFYLKVYMHWYPGLVDSMIFLIVRAAQSEDLIRDTCIQNLCFQIFD